MAQEEPEVGSAWWGIPAFVVAAFAQGIIPFTHTVQFGPGFQVTPKASTMPLWRDVLNAGGIGLLVQGAAMVGFAACYVSLCRAYGEEDARPIARRAVFANAWLYPMLGQIGVPAMVVAFAAPEGLGQMLLPVVLGVMLVPLVTWIIRLARGAERAGVAGAWSWALVLIPMILAMVIEAVLVGSPPGDGLLGPWLPHFAAS
ncbi:MAG: hypothetical protein CMN30_02815 [Sandaracinus sp.]|nr:hypothetical protein [Sandaracinus sp.]